MMKIFSPGEALRILVVEDDRTTFIGLQLLLHHYGYEAEVAETLKDGLAKLQNKPLFVCLDLTLPDGDGLEILSHIRLRALPIKVAIITASEDAFQLRKARGLMPDLLLKKPIDFLCLLETLRELHPTVAVAA